MIKERLNSQIVQNLLPSEKNTHWYGAKEDKTMSELPQVTRDLIQKAKDGNRQAVSILYRTYADAIYRYILMRVNNKLVAEDITADVFTKMVEGLGNYRLTGAPFEAWLYRIASSKIVDHRRKQNYRQHSQIDENIVTAESSPEETILQQQEAARLQQALTQLNEQDRLVIILRFVERKSHKEVADIIGKSEVTVRSIQHRALGKLATVIGLEDAS